MVTSKVFSLGKIQDLLVNAVKDVYGMPQMIVMGVEKLIKNFAESKVNTKVDVQVELLMQNIEAELKARGIPNSYLLDAFEVFKNPT